MKEIFSRKKIRIVIILLSVIFLIAAVVFISLRLQASRNVSPDDSSAAVVCAVTVHPGENIDSKVNNAATNSVVCVEPSSTPYTGNINIARSKTGITLYSLQKWGAKIVGVNSGNERVAAIEINADNVTIDGFDVTGPNIKLGIADEAANTKVINNHVHHIAIETPCDDWGGAGIEHGVYRDTNNYSLSMNNLVENISYGTKANGQTAECEYNQGIYHSQTTGYIINNIVKNVGAFCIHLWHKAHTNYVISNNLVTSCGNRPGTSGITIGADTGEGGSVINSLISNNIVMNSKRGIEENHASGNLYYNNLTFNVPDDLLPDSCESNVTDNSGNCRNNKINVDPKLDSAYKPLANSPVNNAGFMPVAHTLKGVQVPTDDGIPAVVLAYLSKDYEGKTRSNPLDIGPFESDTSSSTSTSVSSSSSISSSSSSHSSSSSSSSGSSSSSSSSSLSSSSRSSSSSSSKSSSSVSLSSQSSSSVSSAVSSSSSSSPITVQLFDFNSDRRIDIKDFFLFRAQYGKAGVNNQMDFNNNGRVDINDFFLFRAQYGKIY